MCCENCKYIAIKLWKIYNGNIVDISVVIESDKKMTICVKFEIMSRN